MMRFTSGLLRHLSLRLALLGGSFVLGGMTWGEALIAQRGPVQRTVQGKVTDKAEAGISGAVVYLKDDHTMSVKSFISEADGGYRFGQLSDGTDYELWAESNGRKSSTKTISSFDTKKSFQINLKVDTSK